jgi:HTTM domain
MTTDQKARGEVGARAGGEAPPSLTAQAYAHWCEFWFEPQETSTLAIMRILFGLVALAWTLTLVSDLRPFFSSEGVLPTQPTFGLAGQWGLFSISSSYTFVFVVFLATVIAAICLTLGFGTRLACIVVWIGILAFTRRNPYVANSGDLYVRVVAFYLILTPAGASLSLRRWLRERDRFWEFPRRSVWGLRLIQMQVSIVYVTAFWDKVSGGPLWNNGTALSYILRIQDLTRFPTPTFPTNSLPINLQTYGTLVVELSLGVLIWNRRLRPYVVALGILLHLGIEFTLRVGFFSMVAIIALLSFVAPSASTKAILAVRDLVRHRFGRESASLPAE